MIRLNDSYQSTSREPKFSPGDLVRHRRYHYRGVVVAATAICQADEKWYHSNQTQPDRSQPWYHVLVHRSHHATYAAESNLEPDPLGAPVKHPLLDLFFYGFEGGRHLRNEQSWPGAGGRTEHCMWNGPVWPHANSIIAGAMGQVLLGHENHDLRPADFKRFLESYALLHFEDGDLARPMIRETADAETGKQWGCPDYFHSTWIDLVFRYHRLVGWPTPEMP